MARSGSAAMFRMLPSTFFYAAFNEPLTQRELVPVVTVFSLGSRFRQLEAGSNGYCIGCSLPDMQVRASSFAGSLRI
jgi:hypothetical protein